jgi:hypothetical protein
LTADHDRVADVEWMIVTEGGMEAVVGNVASPMQIFVAEALVAMVRSVMEIAVPAVFIAGEVAVVAS